MPVVMDPIYLVHDKGSVGDKIWDAIAMIGAITNCLMTTRLCIDQLCIILPQMTVSTFHKHAILHSFRVERSQLHP